jgi:CheY-like chemotaxis protein
MAVASSGKPTAEPPAQDRRRRILIVEDQPLNQMFISEVLETEGYAVETVDDGQLMQDKIETLPADTNQSLPDVVLMDIQLPRIDGFELIQTMRSHPQWRSIPIIAITALAMPGDENRCLAAGADTYISKPLTIESLLDSLKNLGESPEPD